MQITVEVKQAQGEVREGVTNNRPWKMASQQVAVFMPGADYPVAGKKEAYVPKEKDGTYGEPEWMKPGRYYVELTIKLDKFGTLTPVIGWRSAKPIVAQAPQQKAA